MSKQIFIMEAVTLSPIRYVFVTEILAKGLSIITQAKQTNKPLKNAPKIALKLAKWIPVAWKNTPEVF
jgi:hypothetical protein